MKKLLLTLFVCCMAGFVFAQKSFDPQVFGKFSPNEAKYHLNEFLPIYFDGTGFDSDEIKNEAGQLAQKKLVEKNGYPYQAYFNAAVIYATDVDFARSTYPLNETDTQNALRYATKAISLSPQAPYMYLIRGEVYERRAIQWYPHDGYVLLNKELAQKSLADYEKVFELNPSLAPMSDMAVLAQKLNLKDKAALYAKLAEKEEAGKDTVTNQAKQAKKATKTLFYKWYKHGR